MTPTPSDALNHAADYIEANGWNQGSSFANDGKAACASQAICTYEVKPFIPGIITEAHEILRQHLGGSAIVKWNDAPGQTKHQVINELRKAANDYQRDT